MSDHLIAEANRHARALTAERDQLRAEVERWELAFQEQYARAERAEAELKASRYETVKAAQEGLRECIRADRAEDELLAVKMELDQVACARTDGILRESDLQCALNMEREKVKRLTTALEDAISTYDPHRKETLVTAERQEAWIAALKGGAK